MNEKDKKNMNDLIKKFKELMPNKEIRQEPETATNMLVQFEKEFNINTTDVINEKQDISYIPKEIVADWKLNYRIFTIMKGSLIKINHI